MYRNTCGISQQFVFSAVINWSFPWRKVTRAGKHRSVNCFIFFAGSNGLLCQRKINKAISDWKKASLICIHDLHWSINSHFTCLRRYNFALVRRSLTGRRIDCSSWNADRIIERRRPVWFANEMLWCENQFQGINKTARISDWKVRVITPRASIIKRRKILFRAHRFRPRRRTAENILKRRRLQL